jgi:hypothetical protein
MSRRSYTRPARVALILLAAVAAGAGNAPVSSANSGAGSNGSAVNIVGGSQTTIDEWPWMVALVRHSKFGGSDLSRLRCGGSLLKSGMVLTAAHCVEGQSASNLQIVTGRTTLSGSSGQRLNIAAITIEPDYNTNTAGHDAALLDLTSSSTQAPIAIAGPTEGALWTAGTDAWVTGWGDTSDGGKVSDTLRAVDVPIVDDATCATDYGAEFEADSMICAGPQTGGRDSCQGDSGGPLVAGDGAGGWRQVGVVSWGEGCAQPNFPGVYSRVAQYGSGSLGQWISDQLALRITQPPVDLPVDATPPPTSPVPQTAPVKSTPVAEPASEACKRAQQLVEKRRKRVLSARLSWIETPPSGETRRRARVKLRKTKQRLSSAKRRAKRACA